MSFAKEDYGHVAEFLRRRSAPVCESFLRAALSNNLNVILAALDIAAAQQWQPIETAPKDKMIDILIEGKTRWCDCYYDQICDQWRTTGPSNKLVWVSARAVTHWRPLPTLPETADA